jgi:hypothetical protein
MIVTSYTIAAVLFVVGVYLIVTAWRDRHRRPDLTERLMRHQPIADQASHWLDQQN